MHPPSPYITVISGQFIHACVVITPLDQGSNRVEIQCKPELEEPLEHIKVRKKYISISRKKKLNCYYFFVKLLKIYYFFREIIFLHFKFENYTLFWGFISIYIQFIIFCFSFHNLKVSFHGIFFNLLFGAIWPLVICIIYLV